MIFKIVSPIDVLSISREIDFIDDYSILARNRLVRSGNKPLPEPMMTKIYIAVWRQ